MLEKAKNWTIIIGIITSIAGFGLWVYNKGGDDKNIEQRLLKDVETRVAVENHVETAPNDVDALLMFQKWDSARLVTMGNEKDAIRSRAIRDSTNEAMMKKIDNMAVTQYQTKQYVDSISQYWKEYNSENND